MLSKKYESTRELLGALMEGGEAVKRDNPRGNETSYFFMVPKAQSPTGEEVINVPDGVDPQAFKAAGYKVPETASASSSGFGSTQNSGFGTQNPWGSNTGYGSTENTTPSFWGSTNSGLGSSSNSWGSNNGFGNPFNFSNTGLDATKSSTGWGSHNSWDSNSGFGLNSTGNNSLGGSWNNGTNTLNNGLGSTPTYMGSNTSSLGNGISSMDNTQNALNRGGGIPSLYGWNQYQDFLNKKRLEEIPKVRPVIDNSQYSLWRPIELLDTFKSGKYRTYASDKSANWGDGSNIDIKGKIEEGVFSQKPAELFDVLPESRKNFPKDSLLYSIASKQDRRIESIINGINATVGPIADFIKALKIRDSGIIGADKVAHCTANYNATKRGPWGEFVANKFDAGKELWDSFIKGINVQDSNDDYAANKRGQRGAKLGLTVQQACPTHPREYLVQD